MRIVDNAGETTPVCILFLWVFFNFFCLTLKGFVWESNKCRVLIVLM